MGILLTEEDGVNFEHHPDLERLLKAQVKKMTDWLYEHCKVLITDIDGEERTITYMDYKDWQALLKELE